MQLPSKSLKLHPVCAVRCTSSLPCMRAKQVSNNPTKSPPDHLDHSAAELQGASFLRPPLCFSTVCDNLNASPRLLFPLPAHTLLYTRSRFSRSFYAPLSRLQSQPGLLYQLLNRVSCKPFFAYHLLSLPPAKIQFKK